MTKKVRRRVAPPMAWQGMHKDQAAWCELGASIVISGEELLIERPDDSPLTFLPLTRWFDRSRRIPLEARARFYCHCGSGPVATLHVIDQPGREAVAEVRYQLRSFEDRGDEMTIHRAVFHRVSPHCGHGPLLLHENESLEAHCRSHDLTLSGTSVVSAVAASGGWKVNEDVKPPQPIRRVLR